jgi:hypothetical protein
MAEHTPRTVTVGGKRWLLKYVPMRKWGGSCDDPNKKGKQIKICRTLLRDTPERTKVLLHEIMHASNWHLDETSIRQIASDMARILEQEGCLRE